MLKRTGLSPQTSIKPQHKVYSVWVQESVWQLHHTRQEGFGSSHKGGGCEKFFPTCGVSVPQPGSKDSLLTPSIQDINCTSSFQKEGQNHQNPQTQLLSQSCEINYPISSQSLLIEWTGNPCKESFTLHKVCLYVCVCTCISIPQHSCCSLNRAGLQCSFLS